METSQCLRTLQKKRTTNFREDETKLLIQLWGSPQIQNKLYLTHRKAPVMRLLAANMQRHGFYRTPDEIKTRIRNLKCLYHRIKRTMQSGAGIGTVDPDWPHFKAMDNILAKEGIKKDQLYKENIFEGPRCEDIKQEVEDIEINDDMESYTTNSLNGSEYEDDAMSLPALTPAPTKDEDQKQAKVPQQQVKYVPPTILPNLGNFAIPFQTQAHQASLNGLRTGTVPSLPFPLLIVQSQQKPNDKKMPIPKMPTLTSLSTQKAPAEVSTILKELLDVQKENLSIEKEKLELEKQRLEFERVIGSQLLTLVPVFGGLLQRLAYPTNGDTSSSTPPTKNGKKRKVSSTSDIDMLKDNKILRTVLERGIKKYMLGEDFDEEEDQDDSENEDSGVITQNDETSDTSNK